MDPQARSPADEIEGLGVPEAIAPLEVSRAPVRADSPTGTEPQPDPHQPESRRLSELGERQVAVFIDAGVRQAQKELLALGPPPVDASAELRILRGYLDDVLVSELLMAGNYVAFPEGEAHPSTPSGTKGRVVGPFDLGAGKWGSACFAIDRARRKALTSLYATTRERTEQEQLALRTEFNARPHEARRAWVGRYAELEVKVTTGAPGSVSSGELVEYATMTNELRAAGAFCEAWSPIWRPRSDRAAPSASGAKAR